MGNKEQEEHKDYQILWGNYYQKFQNTNQAIDKHLMPRTELTTVQKPLQIANRETAATELETHTHRRVHTQGREKVLCCCYVEVHFQVSTRF